MNPPANAAAISAKAAKMRNGRARKVFIPITDEILFERPELITSPLRPYQVDHPCFHWLAVEVEAVETPCAYTPPCKDAA